MSTIVFNVPLGFPRRRVHSALGGAQRKFNAEFIDGRYVVPTTVDDEQHADSFQYCEGLAQTLLEYMLRKARENPDWSHQFSYGRTYEGVKEKAAAREWDLTREEVEWTMGRLQALLVEAGWDDLRT